MFVLQTATHRYSWDSDYDDMFTPKKESGPIVGGYYFYSLGNKPSDNDRYAKLVQANFNKGMPEVDACEKAFNTLLSQLRGEGRQVGGQTFCQTISKKQSTFMKAAGL